MSGIFDIVHSYHESNLKLIINSLLLPYTPLVLCQLTDASLNGAALELVLQHVDKDLNYVQDRAQTPVHVLVEKTALETRLRHEAALFHSVQVSQIYCFYELSASV